jgi:hypothetical protein
MKEFLVPTGIDLETLIQWVRVLVQPGDVHELQFMYGEGGGFGRGYFSDPQKLAEAIDHIASRSIAESVRMTINPCDPTLLERADNRLEWHATRPTASSQILKFLWMLIDIDPARPAEVSSTESERQAAKAKAREILAYLAQSNWPEPILIDSGNGYQLRYRIDLPNTEGTGQLIMLCLQALAAKFGDAAVKVGTGASSAACTAVAPGSVVTTGGYTRDRPHRVAGLMRLGSGEVRLVPKELLEGLAFHAVKHWYGEVLDLDWSYFIFGELGGSEWISRGTALRRISEATAVLGAEAIHRAAENARGEFKAKVDNPHIWEIFEDGTKEQWEPVADEIHRLKAEQESARRSARLEEL